MSSFGFVDLRHARIDRLLQTNTLHSPTGICIQYKLGEMNYKTVKLYMSYCMADFIHDKQKNGLGQHLVFVQRQIPNVSFFVERFAVIFGEAHYNYTELYMSS